MKSSLAWLLSLTALTSLITLPGCQSLPQSQNVSTSAQLFQGPVRELLEHRCSECHHHGSAVGGLNVLDRAVVFTGNESGPFVVPRDLKASRLWKAIDSPQSHPRVMPGDGWLLTDKQKHAVRQWIETGAEWPEGRAGKLSRKKYQVELDDLL